MQAPSEPSASLPPAFPQAGAYNFAQVSKSENDEIVSQCKARGVPDDLKLGGDVLVPDRFALAFSGGGIRSACIALGLVQGLARARLLPQVHTISAISGGGYLLAWLTACLKREPAPGTFVEMLAEDRNSLPATGPAAPGTFQRFVEPEQIHHLRRYSSYLTPRLGLLSGDTLAMSAIYLRNLLLNLTMLLAGLMALTFTLQLALARLWPVSFSLPLFWTELLLVPLCFLLGVALAGWSLYRLSNGEDPKENPYAATGVTLFGTLGCALAWHLGPRWFSVAASSAFVASSPAALRSLGAALFQHLAPGFFAAHPELRASLIFAFALALLGLLTSFVLLQLKHTIKSVERNRFKIYLYYTLAWLSAAGLTFAADATFAVWLHTAPALSGPGESYTLFGLPAVLLALPAVISLLIGILGDAFPDANREWLARSSGSFAAVAFLSLAALLIEVHGARFITGLFALMTHQTWRGLLAWCLPGGWLFIIISGVSHGQSAQTSGTSKHFNWMDLIVALAPPLFLLGLLLLGAWSAQSLLQLSNTATSLRSIPHRHLLLLVSFLIPCVLLALRLDVNEFSMHLFYRNRLVRAFLGASNTARASSPFTGFAETDDTTLASMTLANGYRGPYPLWGTTLNLTSGKDLAWQQRKGASFLYSPLFCGWDFVRPGSPPPPSELPAVDRDEDASAPFAHYGYRSTQPSPDGAVEGYGGPGGAPTVGSAMAASGAAASPNMGYHSRPAVAALMAIFNVRLGWWTGNPRSRSTWNQYAPSIYYLLAELFGQANDESSYVYLSDGGHFENLGLYELVRRRTRFIICSDAAADPHFTFGDLGNAIERCRTDFGVEIKLSAQLDLQPSLTPPFRAAHYAIGEITYPGQTATGTLLYLKSSLTEDEPSDVLGMAATDAAFPHDTTANQFFKESMFEAYRALGQHIIEQVLERHLPDSEVQKAARNQALPTPSDLPARDRVAILFESLRAPHETAPTATV